MHRTARRIVGKTTGRARLLKQWMKINLVKASWIADKFADPWSQEQMLLDRARCTAYREAILRTVKPGDVVIDLGAGTGLLSFFAVQAGARHVYAIEMSRIADVAEQLIAANRMHDRITLIRGNSREVDVPERADVLVTETLSTCGFDDENIIAYIEDARDRMLKADAIVIPQTCSTLLMPIQTDEFGPGASGSSFYGLDYGEFWRLRYAKPGHVQASGREFIEIAEPARCWPISFTSAPSRRPGRTTLQFVARQSGRIDGFVGWFESTIAPGITLSNSPRLPVTSWQQEFFPVFEQPRVERGDAVILDIDPQLTGGESQWAYTITIETGKSNGPYVSAAESSS
jgi:hypothetical protein